MIKQDLEKAEELESKLPTSARSQIKQENSSKTCSSPSLSTLEPWTLWVTTNWKMLKELPTPKHLTCCLRNLYAGQESTVRVERGTMDWFQTGGKEYVKATLLI